MSERAPITPSHETASLDAVLAVLRAAGEPTRLRVLALLAEGELNVTDLTVILSQSQPRISRHLKLMTEAGLIERHREGSWAFFRLSDRGANAHLCRSIIAHLAADDAQCRRDRERLNEVRGERSESAAAYFNNHAADWDEIRALHIAEDALERSIVEAIGPAPVRALLDIGTGTGRMLELLAPQADRAVGLDQSVEMLAVARANLAREGLGRVQLRHGDIYALPFPEAGFDLVVIHHVLHFLEEPARAIREAARMLAPGGRLLVVDFAPHELEFLREAHAHRRLGFSRDAVTGWMEASNLELASQRDLPPPGGAKNALTVSLWLARDPRVVTDLPATTTKWATV